VSPSGYKNKTQEYIEVEQDANEILSTAGIFAPSVPITTIKKILIDVTINTVAFSNEALGFSYPDNGMWRILINPDQSPTAQRFTAFHEFYHMLQGKPGYCRDTEEGSFEESKANYFAACVLMPARWVRRYWDRCHNIATLARIFDVSQSAMEVRLKGLEHYLAA
jgi:Zn-dependent peptidase ImmA (M78 family)